MKGFRVFRMVAGVALLVGASSVASAQDGGRGGRGGPQAGRALLRDITLSDAQKAKVDSIETVYAQARKARANGRPGAAQRGQGARQGGRAGRGAAGASRPDSATMARLRSERQQAMQAEFTKVAGDLRTVLTAEQQVTFDKNLADAKARMEQRAKEGRAPGGATGAGAGRRGVRR